MRAIIKFKSIQGQVNIKHIDVKCTSFKQIDNILKNSYGYSTQVDVHYKDKVCID